MLVDSKILLSTNQYGVFNVVGANEGPVIALLHLGTLSECMLSLKF